MKGGIHNTLVNSVKEAVNPDKQGTKASAHYALTVDAGRSKTLRLRLSDTASAVAPGQGFDVVLAARRKEADEFYASIIPPSLDADAANVMRLALAGMLWSEQLHRARDGPAGLCRHLRCWLTLTRELV